MKRILMHKIAGLHLVLLMAALASGQWAHAQAPLASAALAFTYTFESDEGTNASAVAYIPGKDLYITCIAGNADYPLEVFDRSGKTIESMSAGLDLRGLWYNPATKNLEANVAGEGGWYTIALGDNGVPTGDWTCIRKGLIQPDFQSVLAYVPSIKKLVTTHNGFFSYWGRKNFKQKVRYQHGTPGDTDWYFNPHTAGYTGNDDYPIAVLELNAGQILYFDLKGLYLGATTIDGGLPEMDGFRFAFANRHAFIYDEVTRTWSAYRVF
jgi:hypothetical protein